MGWPDIPENAELNSTSVTVMANSLFNAVQQGRIRQAKFLLDNGVSLKSKNEKGQNLLVSALHIESVDKRAKMFRFLLSKGVNSCEVDKFTGRDILSWACALNRPEEVEILLATVAGELNLARQDKAGLTPLHHAVLTGNTTLVRHLLEVFRKYRLSVDIPDKDGMTPFLYAKKHALHNIAIVLVQVGGASPHQFDSQFQHSADGWAHVGLRERAFAARQEEEDKIAQFKIRGRIPPSLRKQNVCQLPPLQLITPDNRTIQLNTDVADGDVTTSELEQQYTDNYASQQVNPLGKSVDTAFSLLNTIDDEKSSRVTNFVSSEVDTSKTAEFSGTLGQISDMLFVVAQQQTGAFRVPAKPPTPPPPPVKVPKERKKVSTLAVLFGREKKGRKSKSRSDHRRPGKKSHKKNWAPVGKSTLVLPSIHYRG